MVKPILCHITCFATRAQTHMLVNDDSESVPLNVPFPLIQAAISINEEFAVNGITDQVCVWYVGVGVCECMCVCVCVWCVGVVGVCGWVYF